MPVWEQPGQEREEVVHRSTPEASARHVYSQQRKTKVLVQEVYLRYDFVNPDDEPWNGDDRPSSQYWALVQANFAMVPSHARMTWITGEDGGVHIRPAAKKNMRIQYVIAHYNYAPAPFGSIGLRFRLPFTFVGCMDMHSRGQRKNPPLAALQSM